MHTVLLKFKMFALKHWTCSAVYGLVANVQNDARFGLSLMLCIIFKICGHFSENAIL